MESEQLPVGGVLLFFIITAVCLALFLFIQFKLAKWQEEKGRRFCEKAERDGRKVTAYLEGYTIDNSEDSHPYVCDYFYIAPNGRRYQMRGYHCVYKSTPPEERTVYLHPRNYRKYYSGRMDLGKHPTAFVALTWLCGLVLYWLLMTHLILPIILPSIYA